MANVHAMRLTANPRFDASASPAIAKLIGFRLIGFDGGDATVELHSGPEHYNPMGTVHGGVLCDIADAAMGMAFASTLDPDQSFTTLELKITFPDRCGSPVCRPKPMSPHAAKRWVWSSAM